MKNSSFKVIVLNIYEKDEDSALVKTMDEKSIKFFHVKGFFKIENKNRKRISIGSLIEAEYLDQYSKRDFYFLKRANLIKEIDLKVPINQQFLAKLLYLLQKIEQTNQALYQSYVDFLMNWKKDQIAWFMSFLYKKILDANNKIMNFKACAICGSNQKLYAFNWEEGGFFCFDHHLKNHRSNQTNLSFLKSLYYLAQDLNKYYQNTSAQANKEIFDMLEVFDQTY